MAVFLLALGYAWCSGVVFSQEEDLPKFSSGIVKSVYGEEITVTEYDYDNDEEIDNTYVVDQATELKGVSSLNDIAAEDNIDIVYGKVNGKNVAQSITIEKPTENDDPVDGSADSQTQETGI